MLGIPTLLDRTIQQAIVMTIGDAFEDQFSDKSYGFREGRNCQQAVQRAQKYIEDGNRWVVEMDLSNDNVPVFLQQSSFACGTAL